MTFDYGGKISKAGYDVKSTGIENQIFNSEKNCIKIAFTGTVSDTISSGGGSTTFNLEHGFDFAPGFLVWFEIDGSGEWFFMNTQGSFIDYVNCNPYSDETYLTIPIINNGTSEHTVVCYYAILADEGA